ncbi:MAG: hypothetical protein JSU65_04505, partial [Candidatus Zixiibacteriota bacterium]
QGFYQNLRGNYEPLTMDRWWMRMFNRLTGRPFKKVQDATLKKNVKEFKASLRKTKGTYPTTVVSAAKASTGIEDPQTDLEYLDLAVEVDRIYQRDFTRTYNQKYRELKRKGVATARAKELAKKARPAKTNLFKIATTTRTNFEAQLQEDPRNATDRKVMRSVTNRAIEILKQHADVDIVPADLQALLWYAEKNLMASMGVRRGKGENNDYADGAIYVLKRRGVSDKQIKTALPESERYRIDPDADTRGQLEPIRRQISELPARRRPTGEGVRAGEALYSRRATGLGEPAVRPSGGIRSGRGTRGVVLGSQQSGASSFPAVHYGRERVDTLNGEKYGTGIRGAEAGRLSYADDPRISSRAYFYIEGPDGNLPRPEGGLGQHVFSQKFNNILDNTSKAGKDLIGRVKRATGLPSSHPDWMNAFESAVINAGYDGYAVPKQGMMVVLNSDTVPVNYLGTRDKIPGTHKDMLDVEPVTEE